MKEKLATTLAVLPAALLATMAISSATVWAASLFGVEIPEQAGLEDILRMRGAQLANAAFMLSVVLPVAEELVFRGALFQFPLWIAAKARRGAGTARWQTAGAAVLSSALFSSRHAVVVRTSARQSNPARTRAIRFMGLPSFG